MAWAVGDWDGLTRLRRGHGGLSAGPERGGRKTMKTFLIFDLRFLIGRCPVIRVGGNARAKRLPLEKRQRTGALQDAGASSLMCSCKYVIARRLGPFYTLLGPFLSHRELISRRLQRKQGLFKIRNEERFTSQGKRVSRRPLLPDWHQARSRAIATHNDG
jgi:hypothetical protein